MRVAEAHGAGFESRHDMRVAYGRALLFAQVAAHPGNAFAAHEVVGVDRLLDAGKGRDMATHHDCGVRRQPAHHAAHFPHLAEVDNDRGDAHDVVTARGQFPLEDLACRKVEHRARGGDVPLDHHQAPGAVKHPQGERALLARHLVVVQLHGVDTAAAELVVLRVGSKHGRKQDAGARALGVPLRRSG